MDDTDISNIFTGSSNICIYIYICVCMCVCACVLFSIFWPGNMSPYTGRRVKANYERIAYSTCLIISDKNQMFLWFLHVHIEWDVLLDITWGLRTCNASPHGSTTWPIDGLHYWWFHRFACGLLQSYHLHGPELNCCNYIAALHY